MPTLEVTTALEIVLQNPATLADLISYLGKPQDVIMAELAPYLDSGVIGVASELVNNSPKYFWNS